MVGHIKRAIDSVIFRCARPPSVWLMTWLPIESLAVCVHCWCRERLRGRCCSICQSACVSLLTIHCRLKGSSLKLKALSSETIARQFNIHSVQGSHFWEDKSLKGCSCVKVPKAGVSRVANPPDFVGTVPSHSCPAPRHNLVGTPIDPVKKSVF